MLATMNNFKKGFTLVEILVVVAIIALIAAIAIPNLIRARVNANEAAAQATLKAISNAMENYASINSKYPSTTTAVLGVTPPYLNKDYFTGNFNGYSFTSTLGDYAYTIRAVPTSSSMGIASYTITTGAVLTKN